MSRALVVDDNDEIRDFVSLILQDFGFSTVMASNGNLGLRAMKEAGPFDVAIVDLYMPELDGIGFIQAVRAEPTYKKTRLLVATNASLHSQVQKALDAGADEYLMKPFSSQMLKDKLTLLKVFPD
jgi:two-component system chemotaxis response regulator CheY